jgi:hypothetical protein
MSVSRRLAGDVFLVTWMQRRAPMSGIEKYFGSRRGGSAPSALVAVAEARLFAGNGSDIVLDALDTNELLDLRLHGRLELEPTPSLSAAIIAAISAFADTELLPLNTIDFLRPHAEAIDAVHTRSTPYTLAPDMTVMVDPTEEHSREVALLSDFGSEIHVEFFPSGAATALFIHRWKNVDRLHYLIGKEFELVMEIEGP